MSKAGNNGGFNPFRDGNGRWATRNSDADKRPTPPAGKRYSLTSSAGGPDPKHPVKHEAASGAKVVMTKTSYQVWHGDKLVHEVPATRNWRQDAQAAKTFADGYTPGSPMDTAIRSGAGAKRATVEAKPAKAEPKAEPKIEPKAEPATKAEPLPDNHYLTVEAHLKQMERKDYFARLALNNYQQDEARVNRYLRDRAAGKTTEELDRDGQSLADWHHTARKFGIGRKLSYSELMESQVSGPQGLDGAFARQALVTDRPTLVKRGLAPRFNPEVAAKLAALKPGDIWEESGYTSTTAEMAPGGTDKIKTRTGFYKNRGAGFYGDHVVTIRLPQGTRYLGLVADKEIILPRNRRYRVITPTEWELLED